MKDETPKPLTTIARRHRRVWFLSCAFIFAMALLFRTGLGVYQMARSAQATALQFPDEQWYWEMAKSLHRGDGLVGEFGHRAGRMPFYPALLSLAAGADNGVVLVRVAQWFVGALGALLVALLAGKIADQLTGVVAGLLAACDPGLVGISNLLLTETLFVTLIAAWWLVGWPLSQTASHPAPSYGANPRARLIRWTITAALASACVYTRPSAVILVGLWAVFVWARRRFEWPALVGAMFFIAFVVCSLVPWAYRNECRTGQWCFGTMRSGISLYDGVRPGARGAGDLADVKDAPKVRGLSEHDWNRYFLDESFKAIRSEPGRIIRLGFVKLARTWSPFLHADEYGSSAVRLVFAAWSLLWYALIAAGLISRRRDVGLCIGLLLPALMICALHFFYVGSVRYRLGAVPTLAVLAAIGAALLMEWCQRPKQARG